MAFFSMCKIVLSSLFKKESTVSFPVGELKRDPLVRGHVEIDIKECIFCGACARKCPTSAISVKKDDSTWEISRFQCIVCNSCVESCPKKCLYMKQELTPASDELITDVVKDA